MAAIFFYEYVLIVYRNLLIRGKLSKAPPQNSGGVNARGREGFFVAPLTTKGGLRASLHRHDELQGLVPDFPNGRRFRLHLLFA